MYVLKFDECANIGTLWHETVTNFKNDLATHCDSFAVEHIPKEIKRFMQNKGIIAKI